VICSGPRSDDPIGSVIIACLVVLASIYPTAKVIGMVRRREMAFAADGSRTLRGRSAAVVGSVVLALVGLCYAIVVYTAVCEVRGPSQAAPSEAERMVWLAVLAVMYLAVIVALVAAVVWRVRLARRAKQGR
jgi:hypothetical protein